MRRSPKPWSLHGAGVQGPSQLVDHQGGQGLAIHLLRNDEERPAQLGHLLQEGQEVFQVADLLLVQQDVWVLDDRLHPGRIGHKVGGDVAPVEAHPLDHLEGGLDALGLFHGDDAVLAHLLHGVGDQVADGLVVIGGDGGHLGDLLLALGRLGDLLDLLDHRLDRLVDAPLQGHGVAPGRHVLHALADDRLGQDGRRGGAVAGDVRGLRGDFLHHLGAHVLGGIIQLDLFRDGHAVLGDGGRAPLLVQDHVPAPGAQRYLHGVGELVHAFQDGPAGLLIEHQLLGWHAVSSLRVLEFVHPVRSCLTSARGLLQDAEDILLAHDQVFLIDQLDLAPRVLPEEDLIAHLHAHRLQLPVVRDLARPYGDDFALLRLLLGGIRDDDAALLGFLLL